MVSFAKNQLLPLSLQKKLSYPGQQDNIQGQENFIINFISCLNVLVQYCLLLTNFHELEQPSSYSSMNILQLKAFLLESATNHMLKVSQQQYTELTIAGQHILRTIPSLVDHKQLLSDIDQSLPTITKGDWWKCINNHYYCTPYTTSGHDHKTPNCPFCVLDY